jgi:hypothetical protein
MTRIATNKPTESIVKTTYLQEFKDEQTARRNARDNARYTGRTFAVRRDWAIGRGAVWLACPIDDRGYDGQGSVVALYTPDGKRP